MTNYFDKIYICNLQKRQEKLTKTLWQLYCNNFDMCNIHIFNAIDGKTLPIFNPLISNNTKQISHGAIGYMLSWKGILLNALENNYEKIIIFDDDIILHKNFNKLYEIIYNTIITSLDWKIILLGASQHVKIDIAHDKPYYHPHITDGSFAMCINKRSMIEEIYNMINSSNIPKIIDSDILRQLYIKYPTECYVCKPNLIIADVSYSDIRIERVQEEHSKKMEWCLSDYNYPLLKPLVTIIIPCYNAEKTIKRCLLSLYQQTYRPLEIIIIDDYSEDNSYNKICDFLHLMTYKINKNDDITFKFYRNEKNKGCYATRNLGIKYSNPNTNFITFNDADDISFPTRITQQVNTLLKYNVLFTTCNILRTHLNYMSDNINILIKDIENTRIHKSKYCCKIHIGLITCLFKKEIFNDFMYNEKWRWASDAEFIQKILEKNEINIKKIEDVMNFLDDNTYIKNIHKKIDDTLYFSFEMNEKNLTSIRKTGNVDKII